MRFIANGHLNNQGQVDELRRHFPNVTIIRLRAEAATIKKHIADRMGGHESRLTGDDLAAASPAHQEAVLAEAIRDQQIADHAGIGDLVLDVDSPSPDTIVAVISRS